MSDRAQVVLVTGASSGIGRATALAYAAEGASVVLAARGAELLDRAVEDCRRAGAAGVLGVRTDVRDDEAVEALFAAAEAAFGPLDVVVHAAMVMAYGRLEDLPADVATTVFDTATHGTLHVARAALPRFRARGEGSLVLVTSLLASVAVPGIGAYVTGKWAQAGIARVLALETRDEPGIRVVTVAPGAVDTPIYRRAANVEGRLGAPPPPVSSPEHVARRIVGAARSGRRRVWVGPANAVVIAGFRLLTPVYDRLVGPLYRRFAHEQGDAGRIEATTGNVHEPSRPQGRPAAP